MNTWPAKHYFFVNGWILRFTEGVTSRANSVFPVQYHGTQKTLFDDIELVERAYKAFRLQPVFTIPEFHEPKNLKSKLLKRGYYAYDHTITLGIGINQIRFDKINTKFKYCILHSRVEEISDFLARFSKRKKNYQLIIKEINERIIIPKKCYLIAKFQNEIIGTLLAVLVPWGYMYIGDVFVHPDYRRQNIATSMLVKLITDWVSINRVRIIWLQVELNNIKALNLYRKLGMKKLYNYYYMKKD